MQKKKTAFQRYKQKTLLFYCTTTSTPVHTQAALLRALLPLNARSEAPKTITASYEMVKKAHSSFVRNLKLTISRNDPTLSLSEMCQHKSTIRLVCCYRWRSPLGALNVKNEEEKQEESNRHRQQQPLQLWGDSPYPPFYWMGAAPRASCRAFGMTSGADLTRVAVPYFSQHT